MAKEKLEAIQEVDLILGNNEKKDIVNNIEEYTKKQEHVTEVMHQEEFIDFGTTVHMDKTRAVVKIQDGCDRFCSYCIIPYARGKVKSRKMESVTEEIEALAQTGVKEVVLTGIHIASYGKDFKENKGLIDLLEKVNQIKNIQRIRLGSLEPTIITNEFLARLSHLEKICHHFHLSLQSGCNDTLKRMNRKYTIEAFSQIVENLRNTYSDVILTTDIIVGFPGETEEEFAQTYEFLKQIKFYKMHIFKYSRRQGTKADKMENQIPEKVQEERSKKLLRLSDDDQREYNHQYIGKKVEVLIEEQQGEYIKGHTQNYLMVNIPNQKIANYHNQFVTVEVTRQFQEELIGNIV